MLNVFNKSKAQNAPTASIYDIEINSLEGNSINLSEYKGKMILIVNVASECGFTKQYADLQKLYDQYQDNLMIIGVPCNQFGEQEPGNADEISAFCQLNYGVEFPIFDMVSVNGKNQSELFKFLKNEKKNSFFMKRINWNFNKFLIDSKGNVIARYGTTIEPKKIENRIKELIEEKNAN